MIGIVSFNSPFLKFLMGLINAIIPSISNVFTILLPTRFPTESWLTFRIPAVVALISSGKLVPRAKSMVPRKKEFILSFFANIERERVSKSDR